MGDDSDEQMEVVVGLSAGTSRNGNLHRTTRAISGQDDRAIEEGMKIHTWRQECESTFKMVRGEVCISGPHGANVAPSGSPLTYICGDLGNQDTAVSGGQGWGSEPFMCSARFNETPMPWLKRTHRSAESKAQGENSNAVFLQRYLGPSFDSCENDKQVDEPVPDTFNSDTILRFYEGMSLCHERDPERKWFVHEWPVTLTMTDAELRHDFSPNMDIGYRGMSAAMRLLDHNEKEVNTALGVGQWRIFM